MRSPTRLVAIPVYPGVQSLDVAGPAEVFATAGELVDGADRYEIRLVAARGEPLTTSSGLTLVPHATLPELRGPIDTLVVPGGEGTAAAAADPALLSWVRRVAPRCRRVTSVCSGAFVLAAAGLLDGRRATTHWSVCELLARLHPAVTVEPTPIFVRDGNVWTSAGVTAGMDLALALVEDDLGRDVALAVARRLVLFLRRPGNQSQFSAQLEAQVAQRDGLQEVQRFVVEHPERDLTVSSLAARAGMSARHFARAFLAEVGVTPARYVASVRLEAARRLLEETDAGVVAVARSCGFGTAETMRRAFLRDLHVSPTDYRRRFRTAATA